MATAKSASTTAIVSIARGSRRTTIIATHRPLLAKSKCKVQTGDVRLRFCERLCQRPIDLRPRHVLAFDALQTMGLGELCERLA